MATLSVWIFPNVDAAANAERDLMGMSKQRLIEVEDLAVVSWPDGAKKPHTSRLDDLTWTGAGWGALWGMLLGMLFFMPILGSALGAAIGGVTGHFANVGIDRDFIADVTTKVKPGTSALFLMSEEEVVDRIREAFSGAELIYTNLSAEQEMKLREAFQSEPSSGEAPTS
ncbi:DUF1269 domain-containing protein [Haloglycomyces albus]|uniref:DUF1269 domain-containing protein n=1 Tax=Haloglycomyces albus TaxID=526067 RepID=UPI00046D4518|nr:DUF1269 domain-containing protein [Haloglycomyces albus]